jgi:predicted enzyme related to lactoylglutathione lyase
MPNKITPFAFVLAVRDLDRSAAYYRDVLGFRIEWPEGRDWRLAVRDGVRVMLGHCPDDLPAGQTGSHGWFAYLHTDDVDALHRDIASCGGDCTPPRDTDHGMREIVVTTIDGHRIVFGQDSAKP